MSRWGWELKMDEMADDAYKLYVWILCHVQAFRVLGEPGGDVVKCKLFSVKYTF